MTTVIWKFAVPFEQYNELRMPEDAVIIHAAFQNDSADSLAVWAIVDDHKPFYIFGVHLVGTGTNIKDDVDTDEHIATLLLNGYIWHLFESQSRWNEEPDGEEKETKLLEEPSKKCTFCKIDNHSACIGCDCTEC